MGSPEHVGDIDALVELAPDDLRRDLAHYRDFLAEQVDPTDPGSQLVENWPASMRDSVGRITTYIDDSCST